MPKTDLVESVIEQIKMTEDSGSKRTNEKKGIIIILKNLIKDSYDSGLSQENEDLLLS